MYFQSCKRFVMLSLEAKTICLGMYQNLFQSLKKYGQRNANWIISSFAILYNRHLSSLLTRSQGILECIPKFPLRRNCRFHLGTRSGCSAVIDQKVSNVISSNADTFLDIDFVRDSKICPVCIFFTPNALLDGLFPFIVGQKNPCVIPINKMM